MHSRTINVLAGLTTLATALSILWWLPGQTDTVITVIAVLLGSSTTALMWVVPVMDGMLACSDEIIKQHRQEQEEWSQTMGRECEKCRIRDVKTPPALLRTRYHHEGRKRIKQIRSI